MTFKKVAKIGLCGVLAAFCVAFAVARMDREWVTDRVAIGNAMIVFERGK